MLRGPSGCPPRFQSGIAGASGPNPSSRPNQADEKLPPMKPAAIDDFLGIYGSQVNDQEAEQIPMSLARIRNGNLGFPRCFATNRVSRRS